MNHMSNILLFASTAYAGMGPYVASIVNSFSPDDNVRFFLVEDDRHYYTKNIKNELLPLCHIEHSQMSKVKTLLNLTLHPSYYYRNKLKQACVDYDIKVFHCITSFHDPAFIRWFNQRGKFVLTVHDLVQHESQKSFTKEWRQNVFFRRMRKCINESNYLLSNSKTQVNILKRQYPDKRTFYSPFPTLITEEIVIGNKIPSELEGTKDYILFFGRIEKYKGLDILIKAYERSNIDVPLVIAGSGELCTAYSSPRIKFINRYIDDAEISCLYKKAKWIVYPYISATQSGVLSLASYYGKPMILSDIPFFRETVEGNGCSIFFESENIEALSACLSDTDKCDTAFMEKESHRLYQELYSDSSLKNTFSKIYNSIKND